MVLNETHALFSLSVFFEAGQISPEGDGLQKRKDTRPEDGSEPLAMLRPLIGGTSEDR
jgi:hypothetical protein